MDRGSSATLLNAALLEENSELRFENAHLKERCRELEEKVIKTVKTAVIHHRRMVIKSLIKMVVPRKILHPRKMLTLHRKSPGPKAYLITTDHTS